MPSCKVVRGAEADQTSKQGLRFFEGISTQTAGSTGICMHLLMIPPGGRGKAHLHEHHETVIYVISGESEMWYGEDLQEHLYARAGDFLFIPAGVPHLPANCSSTEPCIAVAARTDPNEQESVVLLPHLEARVPQPVF